MAGFLHAHGTAMTLIAIVWGIRHAVAWADTAPRMEASIVNQATLPREFVVGLAQAPARQRFWLGPGQARTLRYAYVAEANLAIAELRDGCVVWETRAGNWRADRSSTTATVQKFGIAPNGQVHLLPLQKNQ